MNTFSWHRTSAILYLRGKDASSAITGTTDEEKGQVGTATDDIETNEHTVEKALVNAPKMTDVFTWRHLEYTVPVADKEFRRLLDDVSGYVVPGKLTALMGESGAGQLAIIVTEYP